MFIEYLHEQIWSRNEDLNSVHDEHLVIYLSDFLKQICYDLLPFLPVFHRAVQEMIKEILKKLNVDIVNRMLRHICESILSTDVILKVTTPELMILVSIIDLGMDKSAPELAEPIQNAVQRYFPEFAIMNKTFLEFFQRHRKDTLMCHYYLRVLQYNINLVENDRQMLIQNLEQAIQYLRPVNIKLDQDYNEFMMRINEWKSKVSTYKDFHDFRMSYYGQKSNNPPMILSPLDLYRQFTSIFRVLMSENEFSHKTLILAVDQFEKRSERDRNSVKANCKAIKDMHIEIHEIKKNKRQNFSEIKLLETSVKEREHQLIMLKYEYFKPLKKSLHMLSCSLELVRPHQEDVNVQGIGNIFQIVIDVAFA